MQVGRSGPANEKDLAWGHKYQQTEQKKKQREGGELRTRQTLKENQVGRTEKKYLRAKQNYLQPGLVRV